jgi:hypothetical protein
VDAQGGSWTVLNGVVMKNGAPADFLSSVIEIHYANGNVYQENSSNNWWYWNGNTWAPKTGAASSCGIQPSANCSIGQSLIDAQGNAWAISKAGLALEDGAPAGAGSWAWSRIQGEGTNASYYALATSTSAPTPTPVPTPSPSPVPTPSPTPTPTPTSTPTQATSGAPAVYPLKVGPTGRYIVDQNNTPFIMVGDSPQALIGNAPLSDADTYFADRQANGFNTVLLDLICNSYNGCSSDGTTFDGVTPFTTPGDLTTPNEAYFSRADAYIQDAARHNLVVMLDPIETGGWLQILLNNGPTSAFNYGAYLGNRYKSFPNIIWQSGNDYNVAPGTDAVITAVALGIKSVDPGHLQTIEIASPDCSDDDWNWTPIVQLNAAYTYATTYPVILHCYNQSSTQPVFLTEATYESDDNTSWGGDVGTPYILRLQEYWTMLSGGAGQLYGNAKTWGAKGNWLNDLDTTGVTQLRYGTNLFSAHAWYNLVPDQNHTVVTAGYGTFMQAMPLLSNNSYVTAASTPDGKLAMAYIPVHETITVNLSQLSGLVTATWYDPTMGTYTAVYGSPFINSGTMQFAPPGTHSDGYADWVLVLETNSGSSTPTPAPRPTPAPSPMPVPTPTPTPGPYPR